MPQSQRQKNSLRQAALDVGLLTPGGSGTWLSLTQYQPRQRAAGNAELFISPQAYRHYTETQAVRAVQHELPGPPVAARAATAAGPPRAPAPAPAPAPSPNPALLCLPGASKALRSLQELSELEREITLMLAEQQPAACSGPGSGTDPRGQTAHAAGQAQSSQGQRLPSAQPDFDLAAAVAKHNDLGLQHQGARKQLDFSGGLASAAARSGQARQLQAPMQPDPHSSSSHARPLGSRGPPAAACIVPGVGAPSGQELDVGCMVQHLMCLDLASLEALQGYASGYIDGRIASHPEFQGVSNSRGGGGGATSHHSHYAASQLPASLHAEPDSQL